MRLLKTKIEIDGTFPGLNDFIKANRANIYLANKMKQEETDRAAWMFKGYKFEKVFIKFNWYEKNKKRDKDNIAFAKKFILDGMVKAGALQNDGWKNVEGFADNFFIDRENPHVEVEIIEL